MVLKLYNTLSGQKEVFTPLNDEKVRVYSCGPTVYDYAHIGNWRTFVINDLLRRTLEWSGHQVNHVMNITDVDDKTINASKAANLPLGEYTKKYERIFLDDLKSLNILPPTTLTHATEFIPVMIELIEKLISSGHAYKTSDGVYFRVNSFPDYGKLSKQPIEATDRADDESHDKQDARDFALWKFQTPADGEVGWDVPSGKFGKGRPGWHIECSAMSLKTLGETLDIHTGGSDLMFPHHENEIAQSESLTGKFFARLWLHVAFLQVDGHKMSKSLNNFYTLKDIVEKHHIPALSFRYLLLTAHYRSPINFTWNSLEASNRALESLGNLYVEIVDLVSKTKNPPPLDDSNYTNHWIDEFRNAINNDLNTPMALAVMYTMLKDKQTTPEEKLLSLSRFDNVLGLNLKPIHLWQEKEMAKNLFIENLLKEREVARQAKDWPLADQIRQEIEARGFEIDDTDEGPKLRGK